jgi:crossover junction endodeoxyribonuclease RusA
VTATLPDATKLGPHVGALCEFFGAEALEHAAQHAGGPCPYLVVAEVLAGRPDPRLFVEEWRLDISSVLKAKPRGAVPLSLNDRGMHWASKASAVDRVKAAVRNAVLAAGVPHLPRVHVELHYRPGTNRFRDVDNVVATLKPAIDGLHQRDTSLNAPVPYEPIIDGDDPRFVSWSPPVLLPWQRGRDAELWLLLRSWGPPGLDTGGGDS